MYYRHVKTLACLGKGSIVLDGVPLIEITDRVVESGEQNQTARMYKLILSFTLCKINP